MRDYLTNGEMIDLQREVERIPHYRVQSFTYGFIVGAVVIFIVAHAVPMLLGVQ